MSLCRWSVGQQKESIVKSSKIRGFPVDGKLLHYLPNVEKTQALSRPAVLVFERPAELDFQQELVLLVHWPAFDLFSFWSDPDCLNQADQLPSKANVATATFLWALQSATSASYTTALVLYLRWLPGFGAVTLGPASVYTFFLPEKSIWTFVSTCWTWCGRQEISR